MTRRHEVVLPELGLTGVPILVSVWLVPRGAEVVEGDRLVEILAGSATVDLPAPASGRLARICAAEDEEVSPGAVLAIIEEPEEGTTENRA
jgi:pyruvate/2-oxoglutarate dehydrogenase complex dihydrolipoamide acyltransferase (E2) component